MHIKVAGWTQPHPTPSPVLPTAKTLTHFIRVTCPIVVVGLVIAVKLLKHITDFKTVFSKGPSAHQTHFQNLL